MQVFAEILGVPQDDRRHIIELGDRLLGNQDPEYFVPPDPSHRLLPFSSPAALEMFEFGRKMAAARRKDPGNDIITQLAFEPLTQREFDVYFVLLATAGNETTRHTITHGLLALLEHPDQMERLRSDPALFKPAAEEMLRWATPVHHFRRTTTRETELAGTTIPARREGHDLVRLGQPRRGRCSRTRTRSTSAARRTSTWRSGRAASTTAWARTSRAWRSGSRSRSCSSASTTIELTGAARAAALELLQRHQAPAGAGDAVIALRRIDHVRLRVADVAEAAARWAAQFGLAERGGRAAGVRRRAVLPRAGAGEPSPARRLRAAPLLLARRRARAPRRVRRRRARSATAACSSHDPEGNGVLILPVPRAGLAPDAARAPGGRPGRRRTRASSAT